MAGSVNKVILVGNLGRDPEVRYLESGVPVANFPIATSETYKDRTTGERKSQTEWHNIVLWRGLAEVAEKFLKKGSQIYIEGKLRTRSWDDKEGNTRYTTEVVGDNMVMLSRAPEEGSGQGNYGNTQAATNTAAATTTTTAQTAQTSQNDFATPADDATDDLPF